MPVEMTTSWAVLMALGAFHGLNPGMGWLFAVALGMQDDLSHLPLPWHVHEHGLVHAVVVVLVVGAFLIRPYRFAGVRVAREDTSRPLVVPRPKVRVPRAGVGSAIVDEVECRII